MLRHGLSLIIIGFRIQLAQEQAVVEATPFGAILHPSGQFYITKGLHMNGIKNTLALAVVIGVSVAGLATCAGVKPAHAGEVKWKLTSAGSSTLVSTQWQLDCISDCTEAGNAAAPMPPTPKSAKWAALLPRGKWRVAWDATTESGEHCKGSRTITTCAKLGTCSQEFESHCP